MLKLRQTVVLVGLMGAGKTQVGRRLGARLNTAFYDSDQEVEAAAGMSVSDIFSVHGEAAFRDAERKVIKRLVSGSPCVVATGGGAYMNEETRRHIAAHARSIWLRATLEVLHARTSRSRRRPLLVNADAEQILAGLMEKRYPIYAEAEIVLDSDETSADRTALRVIEALLDRELSMNEATVPVVLDSGSYDIRIGPGLLGRAGERLAARFPGRGFRIVTDAVVAKHHLPALQQSLAEAGLYSGEAVVVPAGEASKSFFRYEAVCEQLLASRLDRQTILIALGGGVIGDLTGFVAATLLRGLDFVQMPTTLLAQVDSSVGGKTGINTAAGKNLVGAFHQPLLVLADLATLATLPPRELRAGYAEVVKHGLALDAGFFAALEKSGPALLTGDTAAQLYAVRRSCELKAGIVARDPFEQGDRARLNFGHTFGHALEALLGYDGRLLHGEGVAIGMLLALDLSVRLGLCPAGDFERVQAHYQATGLPTAIDPAWGLTPAAIIAAMATDKKAKDGKLRFILAHGIGETCVAEDVPLDQVGCSLLRGS